MRQMHQDLDGQGAQNYTCYRTSTIIAISSLLADSRVLHFSCPIYSIQLTTEEVVEVVQCSHIPHCSALKNIIASWLCRVS
jgi:hypothetical protein